MNLVIQYEPSTMSELSTEITDVSRTRLQDVLVDAMILLRFYLRLAGKRNVALHLVSIEVRVECGTNEWVNLDSIPSTSIGRKA